VTVHQQEAIPAFCQAIVQGCCRGVERIYLSEGETVMTQAHLNLLAGALEVNGALVRLSTLQVYCTLPRGLSMLARVLAGGTAPLLQDLYFDASGSNKTDMTSIADMIEARARIPGCKRIGNIDGKDCHWFEAVPRPTQIRMLRGLLPSAKVLPAFTWRRAFQACFRERQAPYLTALSVYLGDDVSGFSWNVFEAAPALVKITIKGLEQTALGVAVLRSVSAALRNGALQHLDQLYLQKCTLGDRDIKGFADALEESGCAMRLASLTFASCGVDVEGVRLLTDLFCRGLFPAMECLDLGGNPNISDLGIMALAEALSKSSPACLGSLVLDNVGMGDEGIAALASLVGQGRMEQLREFNIYENAALTQQGICALARAVDARGLPFLETFLINRSTEKAARGIGVIAFAVFKGCPQLKYFILKGLGPDNDILSEVMDGMLEAAGRAGEVWVVYEPNDYDDFEFEEDEDEDEDEEEEE